ncbi:5-methyltetrahydropteroyltriglutamate--homocysteine S-methyltransferase [Oceanobacillus alkalisoli]|nr:5-methyltetrahydropteroyltriglutamate--homocysteine S-methyltransferase [Oceanobacillus alkalisoli]MCF3943786.1 5-methyltetrahydropteroyltriglutamate--homocysteine S-methyltransferase [Oceanobacillus alkalisoli]
MTTLTKAPFRADHVGSLLRPERIKQARADFQNNKISAEELYAIETEEITGIVDKQIEVGLEVVTDGEFRRRFWHTDFLEHLNGVEGYVPEHGYKFKGVETEKYTIRNNGKVSFNPNHPFIEDFKVFNQIVDGRAVAKQTIPSPNQLFHPGMIDETVYSDIEDYAKDVIQAYRDAIQAFYDAGVRYLQLDDVYIAGLSSPEKEFPEEGYSREQYIDLALRVINGVLDEKPADLTVTTHLCRGNYQSTYMFGGSYDLIAPTLLAKEKVDGFFLEYDDERSGDFKALAHIPKGGPQVVLGLVTSKSGELEDKEELKARIKEATQYIPKEQICLSPQCGFSSTHHGNKLTEEQQWEKLRFIVELSKEIWED